MTSAPVLTPQEALRSALAWPLLGFIEDDGGRAASGRRGSAGDCVTRSIAIATGIPYGAVYDELARRQAALGGSRSARDGVRPKVYRAFLAEFGWHWTPTMSIGSGCTVHLRADELPDGPLVVRLSKHLTAVVDGTIRDTYDPSREGCRCVYGVFSREPWLR